MQDRHAPWRHPPSRPRSWGSSLSDSLDGSDIAPQAVDRLRRHGRDPALEDAPSDETEDDGDDEQEARDDERRRPPGQDERQRKDGGREEHADHEPEHDDRPGENARSGAE